MNQRLVLFAAAAVAALLTWAGCRLSPGSGTPAPARPAARPAGGDRSEVAPLAAPAVVFRGRCIDAATGLPLASGRAGVWELYADEAWDAALASCELGADGVFELQLPLPCPRPLRVHVGAPGRVGRTRILEAAFAAPARLDFGDLPMRRGTVVRSRVVDERGAGVSGAVVWIGLAYQPQRSEALMELAGATRRSGADGAIDWGTALLPGSYRVGWLQNGIDQDGAATWMTVPEAAGCETLLRWPGGDLRQAIRGTVVDQAGKPVARLDLGAEGGGTRGNAETAADGSFLMARIGPYDPAARGPVAFGLSVPTEGYALAGETTCSWGDRDVRLVVKPAAELVVRAVDAVTGAPVREFTAACAALYPGHEQTPAGAQPPTADAPGGGQRLALANLPHLVQVFPADAGLAPSLCRRWAPGSTGELVLACEPLRTALVHVVDEAGAPVPGTEVWSLQPIEAGETGAPGPATWIDVTPPEPDALQLQTDPARRWLRFGVDDAPLGRATTDASGSARLPVPATAGAVLAALGPGHLRRAIASRGPTGDSVELRVQRGASLRVEISPPDIAVRLARRGETATGIYDPGRRGAELWLDRVPWEQDSAHFQGTIQQAIEGPACRFTGVPAGTYDLHLSGSFDTGVGDGIMLYEQLARVELRPGDERVLPIDLSALRPGRLRGQVRMNGAPWAHNVGSLTTRGAAGHRSLEVATDGDGRFDLEVPPGDYRLHLYYRAESGNVGYWFAEETWRVAAGATTQARFDVRRVMARVRLVTAEGLPAAGVTAVMDCAREPRGWTSWTTDGDGWITLDPAPLTVFDLIVSPREPGGRSAILGSFQVPPTGTTAEFQAELPGSWR